MENSTRRPGLAKQVRGQLACRDAPEGLAGAASLDMGPDPERTAQDVPTLLYETYWP